MSSSQQYNFKSNNGSGSSSNLGSGQNRDNLKNLMKKQQQNLNYIDSQFIQENMNRTTGIGSSSNIPVNSSANNYASSNGTQNNAYAKQSGNANSQQKSTTNQMIDAYQKNRPVISQQFQQYASNNNSNTQLNNYGQQSPLRNSNNNVNQSMNSPSSRAATAQDSHRESKHFNNYNVDQLERKNSLGRNKLETSQDAINSSFGKINSSSSTNNQSKSSTNKVQQILKDLMGNNLPSSDKNSYGQNIYSKQNLNRPDNMGNQSSQNYLQSYNSNNNMSSNNMSNNINNNNNNNNNQRNEVSSLRSRENSNDRLKASANNTSANILTQNNMYTPQNFINMTNNNLNGNNSSKHQNHSLSPFQGNNGRQQSGPNNNYNNTSIHSTNNYKNSPTIEISNFGNSINDSYSQRMLKGSSSSKNLQQQIEIELKNQNKPTSGNIYNQTLKGKSPSSQQQQQNNQNTLSSTLNRNNSNSKLRLQDDVIEQTYKNNRSITPKYNGQQQIVNATKNQNNINTTQLSSNSSTTARNKTPSNTNNVQNTTNSKFQNDIYTIGNSASKLPNNNNNTSFSNANNTSFNQMVSAASVNNLKSGLGNSGAIDLQNRRLTPTPINQNIEMFERHQSLQNIIQMQDQKYGQSSSYQLQQQQQQQQQNKSPLRTNNYMQSQQSASSNNSAKENILQNINNSNRGTNFTNNNTMGINSQRESSKSPVNNNRGANTFGQTYNQQSQQQTHSQQLQSNKQQPQQVLQHTQSMRGTSQEAKNGFLQSTIAQPLTTLQNKLKQTYNQGSISGGASSSSSSSTCSNQKAVGYCKQQNSSINQKGNNTIQQNITQKLLQTQQQQLKDQLNSQNQSPFFGTTTTSSNNLKKINPQNQNDLLKTIQDQIKLKNERKQDVQNQPKKQKNKISQDFLDSTYFQFNAQLIEQMQQEQIEDQQISQKTLNNQIKESQNITSIKQEIIQQQNMIPTITQRQPSSQNQQSLMLAQQQQLQQYQQQQQQLQLQNKSKQNATQQLQVSSSSSSSMSANNSNNNQTNKSINNIPKQQNKDISTQQQSQNNQTSQFLQKQIIANTQNIEEKINNNVKKMQPFQEKEKNSNALNNELESADSTNTTTCFSEELSKSTLAKINLYELLTIEQNLFDLQKHGFKNKKHTTKYCKNYLNSIAEQNVDNLERVCCDNRQSTILTKMFILERICVMLSLHESLNGQNDSEFQCDNDEEEDDDGCTNHIKNSLQYVHLNFLVFLDTVVNKYTFCESTRSLEQQAKKLFENRTKTKRFASCLNKQDKFQVISNYCDIIVPYLRNFVDNYEKEPFIAIARILNNISSQTVTGIMSILMDCFSKIISDLEVRATKESKSSIDDSFSDLPTKQDVSTEKLKSNSVNSTTEKQKNSDDGNSKQNKSNDQKQKPQQDTNAQQAKQEVASQQQTAKDYYASLEDEDDEEEEEEDEIDLVDRQIGTIPAPYLPPLQDSNKYTLVLDLDETLVHYQEIPDEGGQFLIRPNAEIFLTKMAQYYEIVIFTAAVQDYADFILNVIDSQNSISYRLYRQHTDIDGRSFVKDISKLGRDLSKTLIIDNLPENFARQPKNGVLIQSWYGEPDDRALYDLVPLLTDITKSKKFRDVREALQKLREQTMKNLMDGVNDPHINLVLDQID